MNHWDDLKSAGTVPPPSPEVLAHAKREVETATRRRVVVPVLAAAATAAVVVGAVAIYEKDTTTIPATQPTPQPSNVVPSSRPPSATPTQGMAASCAFGYSVAELKKRKFAFDGTVLKIVADVRGTFPSYLVTFRVDEWFKPANGARTVTVRSSNPPVESSYHVSTEFPDYTVGTRLLITGEPQWGGADPLKNAIAWGCGFSRAYNPTDAATWRKAFGK